MHPSKYFPKSFAYFSVNLTLFTLSLFLNINSEQSLCSLENTISKKQTPHNIHPRLQIGVYVTALLKNDWCFENNNKNTVNSAQFVFIF